MSFQIGFSSATVPAPPVVLLSAGVDQYISCETVVVLTASVDDPDNLIGHTLLWEQIEGSAVILSDPTAISTTYTVGDQSAKVFRFWIDKGLFSQQYQDVRIRHTPETDVPYQTNLANNVENTAGPPSAPVECDSIDLAGVPQPPILQSAESEIGFNLIWEQPADVTLQPYVTQYIVYENNIPVATVAFDDTLTYLDATTEKYKILTEFEYQGLYAAEFSCTKDFTGYDDLTLRVVDDYVVYQTNLANNVFFSKENFGYKVINKAAYDVEVPNQTTLSTVTQSQTRYETIFLPDVPGTFFESELPYQTNLTQNVSVNITRTSSGSIGGG